MSFQSYISDYSEAAALNILKHGYNENSNFKSNADNVSEYLNDVSEYLNIQLPILFSDPDVVQYLFDPNNLNSDTVDKVWNLIYDVLFEIFPVTHPGNYDYGNKLVNDAEDFYLKFLQEAYKLYIEEAKSELAVHSELYPQLSNIANQYI